MTRYEDKQQVCNAMLKALQATTAFGHPDCNPLVELRYIKDKNNHYYETVRPIFADGTGEDGYYDINVSCSSGTGMIIDIVKQFVQKM